MLTIVDLHHADELSPRGMAAVVGAFADIKGESLEKPHQDWFGLAAASDFVITKSIDKASPTLFAA